MIFCAMFAGVLIFYAECDILMTQKSESKVAERTFSDMSDKHSRNATSILSRITSSQDVKQIPEGNLPQLCAEIRDQLIAIVTKNGGHLASNLGVVELTVAIHRVFDSRQDHVIFDVGHQSYVHKMLTGRLAQMDTLRCPGGLSGFPKRSESPDDAFGTGHASTSLSAGLGFAQADYLSGVDHHTVVVLGDGAFTGGMIHEALNNVHSELPLILIINENEMSISKNIGHFAQELAQLRLRPGYLRTKNAVEAVLSHLPLIGKPTKQMMSAIKRALKESLYGSNYFENMGLTYLGPADGNNLKEVELLLRRAKNSKKACVIHLKTVKGQGYAPAMKAPARFHAVPARDTAADMPKNAPTFSDVFGQTLTEWANSDRRLCAITAAMQQGTGLLPFGQAHPDRLFDVGIAEEHAVTFAAGLCANGYRPVVAIYSTFLQRSYDNILHDVVLQSLPVLFCIDRAGLNAADGPTHHGIFDVAFLLQAPSIQIYAPMGTDRLRQLLHELAENGYRTPVAIRYPSGTDHPTLVRHFSHPTHVMPAEGIYTDFPPQTPPRTLILTYGRICAEAINAKERCATPNDVGIIYAERLQPYDDLVDYLVRILKEKKPPRRLIFVEEGILHGGFAMNVQFSLRERLPRHHTPIMRTLAIRDGALSPTGHESIYQAAGIDAAHILAAIDGDNGTI